MLDRSSKTKPNPVKTSQTIPSLAKTNHAKLVQCSYYQSGKDREKERWGTENK